MCEGEERKKKHKEHYSKRSWRHRYNTTKISFPKSSPTNRKGARIKEEARRGACVEGGEAKEAKKSVAQ